MKFEVYNKDNERIFWTETNRCIPTKDEIDSLYQSGCKFKYNDKFLSKTKINELIRSNNENTD